MLHEILLSLTGLSSPIWSQSSDDKHDASNNVQSHISPSERAILSNLAELSQLHVDILKLRTSIQAQHQSPICLAVCSTIGKKHLGAFRKKILDIEQSILAKDSAYVGGYEIVPLSAIVTEFAPWTRRLQWLRKILTFISRNDADGRTTGKKLLDFLESARHTGYSDIETIANDLLLVAQQTWMRSISTWVLYGQLPSFGHNDFMIQKSPSYPVAAGYVLDNRLTPGFVSPLCAQSILSVGISLHQIRQHKQANNSQSSRDIAAQLLPDQLQIFKRVAFPLNVNQLEAVMGDLNHSISQNALSHLLPLEMVIQITNMLQSYLLLERGEFAIALIANVDNHLQQRERAQSITSQPVRKAGRVESLVLKDAELNAILSKTWADLSALQNELESDDEAFQFARTHARLTTFDYVQSAGEDKLISTLTPVPTLLRIDIPPESPLNIFLTSSEIVKYSHINSHLLSIRRSQIRLADLWKVTSHRRCHPAPIGPPVSGSEYGRRAMLNRRQRENKRSAGMRKHWSSLSKTLLLVNELVAYLQGEVIRNSWKQFHTWLVPAQLLRLNAAEKETEAMDVVSEPPPARDPKAMAQAHRTYIDTLYSALLIDQRDFNKSLSTLLSIIDHFAALLTRLQAAWQGLDLQEDDGIMDAFMNYAKDEEEILAEMDRSRESLEGNLSEVERHLKDIEHERGVNHVTIGIANIGVPTAADGAFVPWRARTLDRLIMKLDFLRGEERNMEEEQEEDLFQEAQAEFD